MFLFDMDGTLIDSNGIWKDVDREFLARRGLPYTHAYYEGVAHTIFPLAAKFTREFCHLSESCEEIMAEWMELARDLYAHVPAKPGVRAYLEQCRAEGRRMAVVTSSVPEHCRTALRQLNLARYFERITFAHDLGLEKKNPDIWLLAAREAGAKTPVLNENHILSMGYSMSGKPDKAKEILQIEIYQNFLNIMQSLTTLLQLEIADAQASKNIIDRINCLSETFHAPELHPATMLSAYLNVAAVFVLQNDTDNALAALQQYCDLAVGISYPISLHGDRFFDRIDEWLAELDLGVHAPRDDKTVRQGIIDGVAKNPVFSVLADHVKYRHIVEKLTSVLGG